MTSLTTKPSNVQVAAADPKPVKPVVNPQNEFIDLCNENLQHPRTVEEKSAAARQPAKSIIKIFLNELQL